MDEIITALKESLPFPVWDTDATGADRSKPYVVVLGSDGRLASETTFCGGDGEDSLRIRHVGTSRPQVRELMKRTRAALHGKRFAGERIVDVRRDGNTDFIYDPDLLVPGSSRHLIFADDEYTIFTQ